MRISSRRLVICDWKRPFAYWTAGGWKAGLLGFSTWLQTMRTCHLEHRLENELLEIGQSAAGRGFGFARLSLEKSICSDRKFLANIMWTDVIWTRDKEGCCRLRIRLDLCAMSMKPNIRSLLNWHYCAQLVSRSTRRLLASWLPSSCLIPPRTAANTIPSRAHQTTNKSSRTPIYHVHIILDRRSLPRYPCRLSFG